MYWLGAALFQGASEFYLRKKGRKGSKNQSGLKKELSSISEWRRRVQTSALFLTAIIAWEFFLFYQQIISGAAVTIKRPAGVEAFLPISALLGLKRFLMTGNWDPIHSAGLTFLIAVILSAVLFRRVFCSWVCPFGAFSRFLELLRIKLLSFPAHWNGPQWLRWILQGIKYLFFAQLVLVIFSMPLHSVENFIFLPYNLAADANMLLMFVNISLTGLIIICSLIALSIIIRNGWCRILCPYGALLALVGILSPFRIRRNQTSCKHCESCSKACGMGIRVHDKIMVHSPECTMCLSCVSVCPSRDTLSIGTILGKRIAPWIVPVGGVAILVVIYFTALGTGYWNSKLSADDYRLAYKIGLRHKN